ncbi:hypothetical protein BOTBODRAFT_500852 [Botryobasidium botryosum FD-172 SS1]|uniref:VanZ-like domain-containing protein n=1 Tax=Botryobasidium botryosum (strain FD-172 SS1) TaxID=930990 RepID=A0A067MEQ3_BOTB1|nr:hypothetical protein BOTBODRAFT_500852 [Botryobasidium botryosum FD-172 SS1]
MPRLGNDTPSPSFSARLSRATRRAVRAGMRSYSFKLAKGINTPIRFRPWFLGATTVVMLILGLLGFTNIPHAFSINDKVLHFVCFTIATGVFYFIFDVDEDARRIWIWRNAALITTGILCFFLGGIVSEIVQSLLPYKTFQLGDVIANLLGSSLGLVDLPVSVSYNLEKYYRRRREIARLYQPLDQLPEDMPSDDDEPMLPMYQSSSQAQPSSAKKARLGNVWDSREDVFGIGDDDDDDDDEDQGGEPERKTGTSNTQRAVRFS